MATAKEWGTPGADRLRELFGRVESFTIGAEEEVLLCLCTQRSSN